MMTPKFRLLCGLAAASAAGPLAAGQSEAEDAMTTILFELEELRPEEVVYTVNGRGVVNVTLDDGVPEALADRFLERLRAHPGISGANLSSADICTDIKR